MAAYFRKEKRYDALFTEIPITVFIEPEPELRRQVGHVAVDQAQRAWDIFMKKITVPQIVEHMAIYGSPSGVWDYYFVQYYSVIPMALKGRLELEWKDLR